MNHRSLSNLHFGEEIFRAIHQIYLHFRVFLSRHNLAVSLHKLN